MIAGVKFKQCFGMQVDTPGKKLLVGVAIGYLALVLFIPTLNVFVQVSTSQCVCLLHLLP